MYTHHIYAWYMHVYTSYICIVYACIHITYMHSMCMYTNLHIHKVCTSIYSHIYTYTVWTCLYYVPKVMFCLSLPLLLPLSCWRSNQVVAQVRQVSRCFSVSHNKNKCFKQSLAIYSPGWPWICCLPVSATQAITVCSFSCVWYARMILLTKWSCVLSIWNYTTGYISIFALASRTLIRIIGFQQEWKTFCWPHLFPVSHVTVAPHSNVTV